MAVIWLNRLSTNRDTDERGKGTNIRVYRWGPQQKNREQGKL
jgi:hypothetical protein